MCMHGGFRFVTTDFVYGSISCLLICNLVSLDELRRLVNFAGNVCVCDQIQNSFIQVIFTEA